MSKTPALFIGHGNPMNTLEQNGYTEAWKAFGQHLPRPKALLVVSAHWYFGATAITAMPKPRTIHDFYGFPQALFDFQYPAPGDTDIPVLQLSINALKPLDYHLDLAARLAPLREQGVMIVASGNVVHNLQELQWRDQELAYDWAERFDDAVVEQLAQAPGDILRLLDHPDYRRAVPTPDHFIPLIYLAGLAAADNHKPEPLVRGHTMGSISMTCFGLGAEIELRQVATCAAKLPEGVPPDQTNM